MLDISTITAQSLRAGDYRDDLPEFYALDQVVENGVWHNEQDVLSHTIKVYEGLEKLLSFEQFDAAVVTRLTTFLDVKVGNLSRLELLKVMVLIHDIAKAETLIIQEDGEASCPTHEFVSAARVDEFSQRFGMHDVDTAYVRNLVIHHGYVSSVLSLMVSVGNKDHYLAMMKQVMGEQLILSLLFAHADDYGADIDIGDPELFSARLQLIESFIAALS